MKKILFLFLLICSYSQLNAETGYDLWLRYQPIQDQTLLGKYRQQISSMYVDGNSETIRMAREELTNGLSDMLQQKFSSPVQWDLLHRLLQQEGTSSLLATAGIKNYWHKQEKKVL